MKYLELARLAGVSVSTVSKVLSGSSEISRETAERVMRVAAEHGVLLTKGRSVKINPDELRAAVLVPELTSIYYSSLVSQLCQALEQAGVTPYIRVCGFSAERSAGVLEMLGRERIMDGVVSLCDISAPTVPLPTVVFNATAGDGIDCIRGDTLSGMNEAVRHLKALGHTAITFIGETHTALKQACFMQAMELNDLPLGEQSVRVIDKRFEEIGYAAAETMLAKGKLPTAVIAAYDEVALGAIHTFTAGGVRVPEELSVIGINDIPFSHYSSVPLTTIQTYTPETVDAVVALLLGRIKGENHGPIQHIAIKDRLVVRETTAPARP